MEKQAAMHRNAQGKNRKPGRRKSLYDIFYAPVLAIVIGTVMFLCAMVILPRISDKTHETTQAAGASQSSQQTSVNPAATEAATSTSASAETTSATEQTSALPQ